jgi:phenylalanine-4-hydroxylase
VTGATDHRLRGDYSAMRPDYSVDQEWGAYSGAEHELWRRLCRRQGSLVAQFACAEYCDVLAKLDFGAGIPRFDVISPMLKKATNWRLVAVPGLLPDEVFFAHLASRRFPVTVWLRKPEEFDYIVEPDIFHDFFGHVPLLFNRVFADYLEAYGKGGLKAEGLHALKFLARLYWYTVEFGLIETQSGPRAYGAGLLSSGAEIGYSIESAAPNRLGFDLMRIMQTDYKIDTFQETYFVIRDFRELFDATAPDFTPYYEELRRKESLAPSAVLASDRVYRRGTALA